MKMKTESITFTSKKPKPNTNRAGAVTPAERGEIKMTVQEKHAREILSNETLGNLLDEWELTTNIRTAECAMVRGWLMDELESRNPEAFDKWLDQDAPTDESLREYMTA